MNFSLRSAVLAHGRAVTIILTLFIHSFFILNTQGETNAWQPGTGFRWKDLAVPNENKTGFRLLTAEQTGIRFTNILSELEAAGRRVLVDGSGIAIGDVDNDGLPDIFVCGLTTSNVLYRNLGGWRFQDITLQAGLHFSGKYFRGAAFADINGDSSLDLLVSATGRGVLCFTNDGSGKFTDVTQAAGTASKLGSMSVALADVDGNGTLDLYVVNYRAEDIRDLGQTELHLVNGQLVVPPRYLNRLLVVDGQVIEYGEPDQLYLNDGRGIFTPVSWTNGFFLDEDGKRLERPPLDWGLTAAFHDLNGDGAPDLYVCNDYWTPDRLWVNDGKGRFQAIPLLSIRNTSASSMGVDFADIDRDGKTDFFVVDMLSRSARLRKRQMPAYSPAVQPIGAIDNRLQLMRNTLFHNRGDSTFEEIANFSGVTASEWSWQPVFLDVDLDGFEDLLITTGNAKDVQDLDASAAIEARQHSWRGYTNEVERQKAFTQERMVHNRLYPDFQTPIVAYRNRGNLSFEEMTETWGTGQLGVHHGIAVGDLDGDGDQDFVVNNLGSAVGVYRNESSAPRVAVRLRGLPPNTGGIGARIKVHGGPVDQSQEIIAGGRYLSGDEAMRVFAVGTNALTIHIEWRSGKRSVVEGAKANRLYEIDEPSGPPGETARAGPATIAQRVRPFFEDVSHLLAHSHVDEAYDDFARQPLLPRKLSQAGPGVAWVDLNRDGWDDLVVGSGRSGQLAVFLTRTNGSFQRLRDPPFSQIVTRDQTGVVGYAQEDGKTLLLIGSANYEDGLAVGPSVREFNFHDRTVSGAWPGQASSTGPLALADIDGDGDLDLFVGGRSVPSRWPEAATSMIFRRSKGKWEPDGENKVALTNVGLVSGSVWSDLNGDGFPELVLACEWGPIRVFRNQSGRLSEITTELGLDKYLGWWNGVTTGDLNGDGLLEIIATNWGLNSFYRTSPQRPLQLYYGDFFQRGSVDLIETEFDSETRTAAPLRMLNPLAAAIPFLRERFSSHRAFSEASISEILKVLPMRPAETRASTLASMIFFFRTNHFEAAELPREAQLAPAFSANVGDFDGDGSDDLFLSQNFFATQPELGRLDAGRGLWLKGDGTGKLSAVPGELSGVTVYGEQRGAALSDFDRDGRLDLVVTQNGAATRLFRNVGGKPALRVRLKGPAGNTDGIGAILRLVSRGRKGAVREIHAGSGYWSQESACQLMGLADMPSHLVVQWPGGRVTTTPIPPNSLELLVDSTGALLNP